MEGLVKRIEDLQGIDVAMRDLEAIIRVRRAIIGAHKVQYLAQGP